MKKNKTYITLTFDEELIISTNHDNTFFSITKNEIEDIFDDLIQSEDDEMVYTISIDELDSTSNTDINTLNELKKNLKEKFGE